MAKWRARVDRVKRRIRYLWSSWTVAAAGLTATTAAIGVLLGGWWFIDERWDQRALAADGRAIQGQLNYQINEVKLGYAKQRLEAAETKWLEFQLRPAAERNTQLGREYQRVLEGKVGEAKREVDFYEEALRRQKMGIR